VSKTIVAIFGCSGHGKSTLARLLSEMTKGKVINFADPVKAVGKHMVGIPLAISHGSQDDKATYTKYGKTARQHLQWIGTEVGRDGVSPNVWVDRFLDAAMEAEESVVIAGDGRFPDEEFHYLKKQALLADVEVIGIVIRRPDYPVNMEHRSESVIAKTPDEDFDHKVVNVSADGIRNLKVVAFNIAKAEGLEIKLEPKEGDRGPHYINTFSGGKIWPFAPRVEDITLMDIAHGLAGENRWSAMARKRINVAWHSNRVRRLCMVVAPPNLRLLAGLYGQLHDAHEAYLRDIPSPLKALFPGYEEAANRLDKCIFTYFGLEVVMPPQVYEIVRACDTWMAGIEARQWHNLTDEELPLAPPDEVSLTIGGILGKEPDPDEDEKEFIFYTQELLNALVMPCVVK
jgi:uncharacterized protein